METIAVRDTLKALGQFEKIVLFLLASVISLDTEKYLITIHDKVEYMVFSFKGCGGSGLILSNLYVSHPTVEAAKIS